MTRLMNFCADDQAVRRLVLPGANFPVLVSIPHAGRIFPSALQTAARVSLDELSRLSDSWVDLIAAPLCERGATIVAARHARAVADCNRHEGDMDPADVAPALRHRFGPPGRKARAGLGVVPTRLPGTGSLWTRPLDTAEFEDRLDRLHRPFHAALTAAVSVMHRRYGQLILIDLHSMPSLPISRADPSPAQIIVGDRFGKSAAPGLATAIAALTPPFGARIAVNQPYAGGYIVERHAAPQRSIHALQFEFDRRLYVDAGGLPIADCAMALGEWMVEVALLSLNWLWAEAAPSLAAE
jgi:N-formylglutamate amidohydrolase